MMIDVENITVTLSGRPVVKDLSFRAMPGKLTAIIGPNGSGKTTTMKAMSGERKFTGNIRFNGYDLRSMSAKQLALSRAVLAQAVSLGFPFLVREVLEMGIVAGDTHDAGQAERVMGTALGAVDLKGFETRVATDEGQQQRGGLHARRQADRARAGGVHRHVVHAAGAGCTAGGGPVASRQPAGDRAGGIVQRHRRLQRLPQHDGDAQTLQAGIALQHTGDRQRGSARIVDGLRIASAAAATCRQPDTCRQGSGDGTAPDARRKRRLLGHGVHSPNGRRHARAQRPFTRAPILRGRLLQRIAIRQLRRIAGPGRCHATARRLTCGRHAAEPH